MSIRHGNGGHGNSPSLAWHYRPPSDYELLERHRHKAGWEKPPGREPGDGYIVLGLVIGMILGAGAGAIGGSVGFGLTGAMFGGAGGLIAGGIIGALAGDWLKKRRKRRTGHHPDDSHEAGG